MNALKEPRLGNYRNSEFLQYIKNVLELINKYNVSELELAVQYNALVVITQELENVFQQEQSHIKTQDIQNFDTKRGKLFLGLKSILEGNTQHFDSSKQEAAKRLLYNLNSYGMYVPRMNYQTETAIIDSMLSDWETDVTLQEAVVLLQLSDWAGELQHTNTSFNEQYLARISDEAENPTVSFSSLRKGCATAYRILIARIKAFATLETNEAYQEIVIAVYELAKQYNLVLKHRAATSKK